MHKDPITVYDVSVGGLAKVRLQLNSDPSDNLMVNKIVGHIGGKGNHFCQKCNVGGTILEKEIDVGYHDLFSVCCLPVNTQHMPNTTAQPGKPRSSNEIGASLEKELKLACLGVKSNVTKEQAATGIKD